MKVAVPLFALACAVATPASAASFQFFEGNNCTQKVLGAIDQDTRQGSTVYDREYLLRSGGESFFSNSSFHNWNDEARSVRITSNWRTVSEPRRISVSVFDSPDEKTNDDWARITVTDAMLIPEEGVCVGSFQRPFARYGITLERHPSNGLDGKVSVIYLDCNAACRANKTTLPMRTKVITIRKPR